MPQNTKRGRHTSVCREVKANINKLDQVVGVKKVILGISRGVRHGHKIGLLRVQRVETEKPIIHLAAYGNKGIMDVTVICHNASDITATVDFIGGLTDE